MVDRLSKLVPKYIFLSSADPLHYSHLNTMKKAEIQYDVEVSLVICWNEMKKTGMFTLREREEISKIYLDPSRVFTAPNREAIVSYISQAKIIFRGTRNVEDVHYIDKLASYYDAREFLFKFKYIQIPRAYQTISSTRLKELVREDRIEEATRWAPKVVIDRIEQKIQTTSGK
ncbi:MAG: hypothetical protein ACW98K_15120 [Candidatus Kariarchaeaceae archaeon]|jgi:phosphopantetheine adenylyltransferase